MSDSNQSTYATLLETVQQLQETVSDLSKKVTKLELNDGTYLVGNDTIVPGIAPKVAYDKNGLIVSGLELEASDIPELSISQISGLKSQLDSTISTADWKNLKNELMDLIPTRSTTVYGSGTKISYDANGYVVSSGDLLASDIPQIPMSKVEGLPDMIEIIESMATGGTTTTTDTISVKSGTYTKVSVDSVGRVLSGTTLGINDMPTDLLTQINEIASIIPGLASQSTMDSLMNQMARKLEQNDEEVAPGTYTKLKVDSKGLVTAGATLDNTDLPEITIDNVTDLKSELNSKANYTDIVELNNTVSMIVESLSSIGEVRTMKGELDCKADADSVVRMTREFESMESRLDTLQELIPNDTILAQLDLISARLSSIEGRLVQVESQVIKYSD